VHIERSDYLKEINNAFGVNTICCLLGSRQCGKTTLALDFAKTVREPVRHFDLEDPDHLAALIWNPLYLFIILDHLTVIVPGKESYRIHELVTVLGIETFT
jgi:predicted AAA+ superfamily ATPase